MVVLPPLGRPFAETFDLNPVWDSMVNPKRDSMVESLCEYNYLDGVLSLVILDRIKLRTLDCLNGNTGLDSQSLNTGV